MSEPTLNTLTQRLDRLEREVRCWRRGTTLTLAFIGAFLLMGQALPKSRVVEAEKFVVKEADGTVRAVLGAMPFHAPGLEPASQLGLLLYNRDGKTGAELTLLDGNGLLVLYDGDRKSVASLAAVAGFSRLSLGAYPQSVEEIDQKTREVVKKMKRGELDPDKLHAALEALTPLHGSANLWAIQGYSSLKISGGESAVEVVATRSSPRWRHGPWLSLTDGHGSRRVQLFLGPDGGPSFTFYDQGDKPRAILGHAALEATRTGTVEQRSASSLVLFDKDGKVIWKAP